jgi:phosphoglycolate phosphatase-like HAD superfamily hydrolase
VSFVGGVRASFHVGDTPMDLQAALAANCIATSTSGQHCESAVAAAAAAAAAATAAVDLIMMSHLQVECVPASM